jgi:hypothetical protein
MGQGQFVSNDFVEKKRHLIGSIINLVMSSTLRDSVDFDALVAFLDGDLAHLSPASPYLLDNLSQFLVEQGCAEGDARAALLFLASKRPDLQLPVKIAPELETLPAATKEKLLGRMKNAGASLGKGAEGLALPAHIGTTRIRTEARPISMVGSGDDDNLGRRAHPAIVVVFILALLAAGGGFAWLQMTRQEPNPPVTLSAADNPLGCQTIRAAGKVALCHLSEGKFNTMTRSEREKAGKTTLESLRKSGKPSQRILVLDPKSGKNLAILK